MNNCSRIYPSFYPSTFVFVFHSDTLGKDMSFFIIVYVFLDLCCVSRRRSWRRGAALFDPREQSSAVPADVDTNTHTHTHKTQARASQPSKGFLMHNPLEIHRENSFIQHLVQLLVNQFVSAPLHGVLQLEPERVIQIFSAGVGHVNALVHAL